MFAEDYRKTFGFRLFKYFSAILLVVVPLATIAAISYQKTVITEELINEGRIIASLVAENSRTWIFAENAEKIRDSLSGVISQKNIAFVAVFNEKGVIICRESGKNAASAGPLVSVVESPAPLLTEGGMDSLQVRDDNYVVNIICPVKMDRPVSAGEDLYFNQPAIRIMEKVIGYVHIGMSKEGLKKDLLNTVAKAVAFAVAAAIAGLVMLQMIVRNITGPLRELTDRVKRFGSGEKVEAVAVSADDEIGTLSAAFNTMADDLRKREQDMIALQDRLRESEKLEALGRFARGIAHDFNNILSTVQGSVYMIEKKYSGQEDVLYYTGQIRNSLSRSKHLLNSIVLFSKTKEINIHPFELNDLIKRLLPVLTPLSGDFIGLYVNPSKEDLFVCGDRLQIEQIIMNLVLNARDAMPGGGSVKIRTGMTVIDEKDSDLGEDVSPGRYAVVEVIDTGSGFDAMARERMFEPFYTTKDAEKGTGLGLSIVHGIVERHYGHIRVKSEPGNGTEFTIYLPLFENKTEPVDNIHKVKTNG